MRAIFVDATMVYILNGILFWNTHEFVHDLRRITLLSNVFLQFIHMFFENVDFYQFQCYHIINTVFILEAKKQSFEGGI